MCARYAVYGGILGDKFGNKELITLYIYGTQAIEAFIGSYFKCLACGRNVLDLKNGFFGGYRVYCCGESAKTCRTRTVFPAYAFI